MSSFNFNSLPAKYLKRENITNLYSNVNENLVLKDSLEKCVETTAFYNGLWFLVVHPSHPHVKNDLKNIPLILHPQNTMHFSAIVIQ